MTYEEISKETQRVKAKLKEARAKRIELKIEYERAEYNASVLESYYDECTKLLLRAAKGEEISDDELIVPF